MFIIKSEGAECRRETGLEVKGPGLVSKVSLLKYRTRSLTWCCETPRLVYSLLGIFPITFCRLKMFLEIKANKCNVYSSSKSCKM